MAHNSVQGRMPGMYQSLPSHSLFEKARCGDRQALADLLQQLREPLCDLARQLLAPDLAQKVAASDLVQETCIDALRDFQGAKVDHLKGLEAWLATLLSNNLLDWQRKFKRAKKRDARRERQLQDPGSKEGLLALVHKGAPSPEELAMAEESRQLLKRALEQLPRGYREIILWRNEERLTWQQIATRLNRSEDAARMLWNRAVERLRRQLRQPP